VDRAAQLCEPLLVAAAEECTENVSPFMDARRPVDAAPALESQTPGGGAEAE